MADQAMERPEGLTDEHLDYLDELDDSPTTPMFGAARFLASTFNLEITTASAYTSYWMYTHMGRNGPRGTIKTAE